MPLSHELLLRVDDFFERVDSRKQGADLAPLYIGYKAGEDRVIPRRAADDGQVLEIDVAHVEADDWSADGARGHIASAPAKELRHVTELRPRDIVDHQVDAALAEQGHGILAALQHPLAAQSRHGGGLVLAGDSKDPRAPAPGELDGRRAHAARGAGD